MADQTESPTGGSTPAPRGPALAILATALRPELVPPGLCPPLRPAEAAALQTAWLKQIAQALPGAAVYLFGRPADAMPMLRYFAGPGVELRPWHAAADAQGPIDPLTVAATELFAAGHGPVLVRAANVPDARDEDLQACLAAARRGEVVWCPDQHGAPWLLALPQPFDAALPHLAQRRTDRLAAAAQRLARETGKPVRTVRRGPWARAVTTAHDLELLLAERTDDAVRTLPVADVQAALQFYATVFGCDVDGRWPDGANVRDGAFAVRLVRRPDDLQANGLCTVVDDLAPWQARCAEHGCIAAGDERCEPIGGGMAFTATDPDGNRLTFRTRPAPS